ncbi:MAG: hypothetical protein HGB10_10980 [Coriobacteriia bacterium]|nr:hypothetical protein [Coriobacteriia bacterium]
MSRPGYRRFNIAVLLIAGTLVAALAALNIAVDPYSMWRVPLKQGFNAAKPNRFNQDRLRVARDILSRDPDTIMLGKSTAQSYSAGQVQAVTEGRALNAAMAMAGIDEARDNLKLAIASGTKLKRAILIVDLFEFSERQATSVLKVRQPWTRARVLEGWMTATLSESATRASFATLAAGRKAGVAGTGKTRSQTFEGNLTELLKDPSIYLPFTMVDRPYEDLQNMVNIARENDIELVVIVNPIHVRLLEGLRDRGLGDEYVTWMRRLTQITPVWDFSGYNAVTTEPVTDEMVYYSDPLHPTYKTSGIVLSRIFGTPEVAGFGTLVTSKTVDAHIAKDIRIGASAETTQVP